MSYEILAWVWLKMDKAANSKFFIVLFLLFSSFPFRSAFGFAWLDLAFTKILDWIGGASRRRKEVELLFPSSALDVQYTHTLLAHLMWTFLFHFLSPFHHHIFPHVFCYVIPSTNFWPINGTPCHAMEKSGNARENRSSTRHAIPHHHHDATTVLDWTSLARPRYLWKQWS